MQKNLEKDISLTFRIKGIIIAVHFPKYLVKTQANETIIAKVEIFLEQREVAFLSLF